MYLVIFLILGFSSIIELKYNLSTETKNLFKLFAYLVLVVFTGLRWETGTDWNSYQQHFDSIIDFKSIYSDNTNIEIGYNFFVWVIKCIYSNYSFFLLIHAIIYYLLLFIGLSKLSNNFFLSLLLLLSITIGVMGSNRQLMAIAIGVYSFNFILANKKYIFILFVLLAFTFHTSALLLLLFLFVNFRLKIITLILILTLSIIIGKLKLVLMPFNILGDHFGGATALKAISYIEKTEKLDSIDKLSFIGLFKRFFLLSIFVINRKKICQYTKNYDFLLNGYILGIAFYFLFADSLLIMINRGSLYFNICEPILLTYQFCFFKSTFLKKMALILLILLSILLFFQSISPYPDLFMPYKGVFINRDYSRIMY
jgi:hypothetical protein